MHNLNTNLSKKNKNNNSKTRKNIKQTSFRFHKEITIVFLEMLLMVKLFHWKTTNYATHKATDELYTKLNNNIDTFIEVMLGKSGTRIDLMSNKTIKLVDLSSNESLKKEVNNFKNYLVSLNKNKTLQQMSNTDLFNIRDTIL